MNATCDPDADGGSPLERRAREAYARLADAEPPPGLVERTREAVAAERRAFEVPWTPAWAPATLAGMRSTSAADVHVVADAGPLRLEVMLHPSGRSGRFALSGQVLRAGGEPAPGLDVVLYVDRRPASETRTDPFGEFAFAEHAGSRFGLKLGAATGAPRVEVWPAETAR